MQQQAQQASMNNQDPAISQAQGNKSPIIILVIIVGSFSAVMLFLGIFIPIFYNTATLIFNALQANLEAVIILLCQEDAFQFALKPLHLLRAAMSWSQEGPVLIVYSSHVTYWMLWVKVELEQLNNEVLPPLPLDLVSDFRKELRRPQRKFKKVIFILSSETLALLASDQRWFHGWKNNPRNRKHAVLCVQNEVFQMLQSHDKNLRLLNFAYDEGRWIEMKNAKTILSYYFFRKG